MSPSIQSNRLIRGLVIGGILGAIAMSITALYGDARALREIGIGYPWTSFGVACALVFGNYLLRFARWELYLRELSIQVPLRSSLLIFFAGFSMSVTPVKMGELLKSWLLWRRYGIALSRSAPIVVVERIADVAALLFLMMIGAQLFSVGTLLVPICIVALLCLLALSQRRVGVALVSWLKQLAWGQRLASRAEPLLQSYWKLGSMRALSFGFALSLMGWALEVAAFVTICLGINFDFGFLRGSFVFATSSLGGALSMLPGGLGPTEFGFTALMQELGASPQAASFCTILTRLATLWFAVGLGLVALAVCLGRRDARVRNDLPVNRLKASQLDPDSQKAESPAEEAM